VQQLTKGKYPIFTKFEAHSEQDQGGYEKKQRSERRCVRWGSGRQGKLAVEKWEVKSGGTCRGRQARETE